MLLCHEPEQKLTAVLQLQGIWEWLCQSGFLEKLFWTQLH